MSYKKLIVENLDKVKITKISIFDFDNTTMDTLNPEIGKPIYKEKTGKDWPHVGWWGRAESLDMNVFDFKPLPQVKSDYNEEVVNDNTLMVSLTGRRKKLGHLVEAILHANGYKFDKYLYNYGADTLSNKIEQMGNLLNEYPTVRTMKQWDDRSEHMPTFKAWGEEQVKSGRLDDYEFVLVTN